MRRGSATVCILALALVLVACGGNTPDHTPTPSFGNPTATPKPTATPQPTATPAPTTASSGGASTGGGTVSGVVGSAATTIAATEKDFSIAIDKSSVPSGMVTFNIKNDGPSPHNLGVVAGDGASKAAGITGNVIKDSETIDQGKTTTLTVGLPPGTYQVVCTVPGHVQLGMILQLTVQ